LPISHQKVHLGKITQESIPRTMYHSKSHENLKNSSKKASQVNENAFSDLNSKRITLNTWSRDKKLEKLSNYVSCQVKR